MIYSQLSQWNVHGKRVFLRADLNVPLKNNTILNDFRLNSILPTLDYLINHNASVILATHIGRPTEYTESLSSRILLSWFEKLHYTILFAPTPHDLFLMEHKPQQIILLENLRFFPEERAASPLFAKQLARTADLYVNDAFGSMHRSDCSISVLPYEFSENKRTIGFLVEKELRTLETLLNTTEKPFVAIFGGKKISDKIPLIKNFLRITDTIILLPAICFSFLKALNVSVGKSLIDEEMIMLCRKIMASAQSNNSTIMFPLDYEVVYGTLDAPLRYIDAADFPDNAIGVAVGPKSIQSFMHSINGAKIIFFNGSMGFAERPETQKSTVDILRAIAHSHATSYIAGGDTVQAAFAANVAHEIDYLSTGGGASLTYLAGNQLPGLLPFEES